MMDSTGATTVRVRSKMAEQSNGHKSTLAHISDIA